MTYYLRLHEIAVAVQTGVEGTDWDECLRLWRAADGVAGRDVALEIMPATTIELDNLPTVDLAPFAELILAGRSDQGLLAAMQDKHDAAARRHEPASQRHRGQLSCANRAAAHRVGAPGSPPMSNSCGRRVFALDSGSAAEARTFAAYRCWLAAVVDTRYGGRWPRLMSCGCRRAPRGAGSLRSHRPWTRYSTAAVRCCCSVTTRPAGLCMPGGPSGQVLLAAPDGAAVAYLDRVNTPGTTLVCTIDPLAHFGHTGATNAGRFLDELLRWVTVALPHRRDGS